MSSKTNTLTKDSSLTKNKDYTLFSWSKQDGLDPISVDHVDGVYIYDKSGKQYLDFSSQLMNVNIGHNHPAVKNAIKEQLDKVAYVFPGMATEPRGNLGEKLSQLTPGSLNKTFFTTGGSDAIENAIKLARIYTGKQKIITRYRSYHGATYGAISAGGDPRKHPVHRETMPGIVHVEDPYCYRCPWGQEPHSCQSLCLDHVERVIQFEGPESIAAILMEGESGSSGCIKYPPGYWKGIKALADKHEILTISDEVMSGFGRCGQWFAIENHGVIPDMIVSAKGLSSGYIPLGAVTVSKAISDYFNDTPLPLGLTYSAHALACAAGLACIAVYEDEQLLEKTRDNSQFLSKELARLTDKHLCIGDTRLTGLLGCIELVKNRQTKDPMAPWNAKPEQMTIMNQVSSKIKELGMHTFVRWNWIFIAPPLTITKDQLRDGLDIISEALSIADHHYDTEKGV
ncbi:aspartate aminotransferase family protein [Candidatus Marinamargulisbacteria bacterium SCGC AG-439-L15]|nr:aspartate aminotransferase family protein [Candidatus Marinamargulisbacteria bacterium SCGC AG-439-L15]